MRSKSPFPPKVDLYTKHGAALLADFIVKFWQLRGFHGVKAERFLIGGTSDTYGVRSNIKGNGYPPATKTGRPVGSMTDPAILAANAAVAKIGLC